MKYVSVFGYKVDTYLQRSQIIEYMTTFGRISNAVTQESTVPIVVTNAGKNAKRTLDVLLSTLAVPTVFSVNVHPQCQIPNGLKAISLESPQNRLCQPNMTGIWES